MPPAQPIVISLGGSLVVPDEIDAAFLKELRNFIIGLVEEGRRFVIVLGGGKTCRKYQAAAREILPNSTKDDLDWVGIHTNNFNAEFMRITYGSYAHPIVGRNPHEKINFTGGILFWGAFAPGHSSDYDAVEVARMYEAKEIVNLSNIDFAYDRDPKRYPDAKALEKITWMEYRKLIPTEWDPGLNSPFDPIAAKMAEELRLNVAILNGKNIPNIKEYLDGKDFVGTHIHP